MCVQSGKPFEPQQTASTLAHMIGHSLGIDHDEDGEFIAPGALCFKDHPKNCLTVVIKVGGPPSWVEVNIEM